MSKGLKWRKKIRQKKWLEGWDAAPAIRKNYYSVVWRLGTKPDVRPKLPSVV